MQEFAIGNNSQGKINILVEDLPSRVAHLYLQKAYGENGERITFYPLTASSLAFAKGEDVIVSGRQGNPLFETTLSHLGVEKEPPLSEGAYRIKPVSNESNKLIVTGGDVAGLLYAIAHPEGVTELTQEGLRYTGGDIFESPAFPYRIYWTWDHSTNWNLDYTGQLDWGCNNEYCKPPEAFVDDYKRLVDHMVRSRANGVLIWGFLRDNHGGVSAGQEICRYAKDRGVKILPSVAASVDMEKSTNEEDADEPPGPTIWVGDPVNWKYEVKNTGDATLTNIEVIDSKRVTVACPKDTLEPGETMICTAEGIAIEGEYVTRQRQQGSLMDTLSRI